MSFGPTVLTAKRPTANRQPTHLGHGGGQLTGGAADLRAATRNEKTSHNLDESTVKSLLLGCTAKVPYGRGSRCTTQPMLRASPLGNLEHARASVTAQPPAGQLSSNAQLSSARQRYIRRGEDTLERRRGAGGARQRGRHRSGSNFYCDTWSFQYYRCLLQLLLPPPPPPRATRPPPPQGWWSWPGCRG